MSSFDFAGVRWLQKMTTDNLVAKPYPTEDDPLRHLVADVMSDRRSMLKIVNTAIDELLDSRASASISDREQHHRALLLRSETHAEMKNFTLAKKDAEDAIFLMPKYVDGYAKLSAIELERQQFGRAEVALVLGLRVDPDNADLKRRLAEIRRRDSVVPDVSCGDGSERAVRDMQGQAGLDLVPSRTPLLVALFMSGDVEAIMEIWQPEMRDFKHGVVENPIIHFVVLGIQRSYMFQRNEIGESQEEQRLKGYKATIDFFFDRGVRLDARDRAGYTAVMHASGPLPQPELLEHLLSKGADPNIRSAYGTVALMDATMNQNVKAVDILMKYGADPYIADNDGIVPYKLAERLREVIAVYHRHLHPGMPAKDCVRCSGNGTKRCLKCRVVRYCSQKCQKEDWLDHKTSCKKFHRGHKRLAITVNKDFHGLRRDVVATTMKNIMNSEIPGYVPEPVGPVESGKLFDVYADEWQKSGNLLVKIQAGLKARTDGKRGTAVSPDSDMLVYNEKRNFQCMLDPKKLDAKDLLSVIEEKGIGGIKGYFWVFMEKGKTELVVITDPILPAQSW